MRIYIALTLNLFAAPLGFLILRDFKLFLYFLSYYFLAIPVYILIFLLSFFDKPIVIFSFLAFVFFLQYSIVIFFTIKSFKTLHKRQKLNHLNPFINFVMIFSLIITILIAEDYIKDFIKKTFISANNITSASSEPSLQLGDYVFIKRSFFNIERGDFVTFDIKNPMDIESKSIVKRVIAIPGDKIKIQLETLANGNKVYKIILNDIPLEIEKTDSIPNLDSMDVNLEGKYFFKETSGEKYYYTMYSNSLPNEKFNPYLNKEIILNPDEYFVLGDNRFDSHDSISFGPIKSHDITGKLFFKYFSINYKDLSCDVHSNNFDQNSHFEPSCPTDWYNRLLRSKIRFHSLGNRGYYDVHEVK